MKHLFIINPIAGKGKTLDFTTETIQMVMAEKHLPYEIQITQHPGHATQLAKVAAQEGTPLRIYACGGDGTLNECVAGIAEANGHAHAAITHFPTGSGNDFLRIFGEERRYFTDLYRLVDGPSTPVDLIVCNGRTALNVCSVGLDARIGIGMARFKSLPMVSGSAAYQLSVLREVVLGIHQPYQVAVDGVPVPGHRFTMICVCNGQYYGGGFHPAPHSLPNDGMLECLTVDKVSRLRVASLVGKFSKGEVEGVPEIQLHRGRTITISCQKENMVNLDGECIMAKEISISLAPHQVQFFYPKGLSWPLPMPEMASTPGT